MQADKPSITLCPVWVKRPRTGVHGRMEPKSMLTEKRSYGRLAARVSVTVILPDTGREVACYTRDISLTGMCLYLAEELAAGTRIQTATVLGAPAEIYRHKARIIWCRPDPDHQGWLAGLHLDELQGSPQAWKNAVIQVLVG